jgi:hypothetical protein
MFIPKEEMSKSEKEKSLGTDLSIWIDHQFLGTPNFKELLIHEFFHAIHYVINPNEKKWIREGLAEVFTYFITHKLNSFNLAAVLGNPAVNIKGEFHSEVLDRSSYGHSMLYFYYLQRECGGRDFFWGLANVKKKRINGDQGLNAVLKNSNSSKVQCRSLKDSLFSFELALRYNTINYQDSSNAKRFYLRSHNSPAYYFPKSMGELNTKLSQLQKYGSVRIKFDQISGNGKLVCEKCRFLWLQDFHFKTQDATPKDLSNWSLFLFKK